MPKQQDTSEAEWTEPEQVRTWRIGSVVAAVRGAEECDHIDWEVVDLSRVTAMHDGLIAEGQASYFETAKALCEAVVRTYVAGDCE